MLTPGARTSGPQEVHPSLRIAIQGELGSNSHMAALAMFAEEAPAGAGAQPLEIVACSTSAEVFSRVVGETVDGAVLPIENSLHGSVAEHYDLLLAQPVRIVRESRLRVRHNVIGRPGSTLTQIRKVLSHPVALSQCRRWLAAHPEIEAVNFYDTAGSVMHVIEEGLSNAAGIAPELAAQQYGAEVLVRGIEDHAENYTRFHLLVHQTRSTPEGLSRVASEQTDKDCDGRPNKASLAFSVAHRPGTLVAALEEFARAGVDLTKIESRPVPGRPWEYVFFVDLRFDSPEQIDTALARLVAHCHTVKELGRYSAA